MPEIAEIARIVHHIHRRLVGKTIKSVLAKDDAMIFGKAGTTATEFQRAMKGKKVIDAGQQGKYFWLIMSSPPHPVLHFGMSGWIYIRGEADIHYRPKPLNEDEVWPPKYWKFSLETNDEPCTEAAFTDPRRLGRVRLLNCAKEDIRNYSPLKENGPDPVIDKDLLSLNWLENKLSHKHVPIKNFLLDQSNISGIGNWVGDEILFNAQIHPEQYSDTLSATQLKKLHETIMYVCHTAVAALADSEKFPKEWLFNYRWGKGKKDAVTCLPNGSKISFVTVGGRTSCIVPSLQKKKEKILPNIENNIDFESEDKGVQKTETSRRIKRKNESLEAQNSEDHCTYISSKEEQEKQELDSVVPETSKRHQELYRKAAIANDEKKLIKEITAASGTSRNETNEVGRSRPRRTVARYKQL